MNRIVLLITLIFITWQSNAGELNTGNEQSQEAKFKVKCSSTPPPVVYKRSKILPLGVKNIKFHILTTNQEFRDHFRKYLKIVEYHLNGQLTFSETRKEKSANWLIKWDEEGSGASSYVGIDAYIDLKRHKMTPEKGYSMRFGSIDEGRGRMVIHEVLHGLGAKHTHSVTFDWLDTDKNALLDLSLYGTNGFDVHSIMGYCQKCTEIENEAVCDVRQGILSAGDIHFLRNYDVVRAMEQNQINGIEFPLTAADELLMKQVSAKKSLAASSFRYPSNRAIDLRRYKGRNSWGGE